MTEFWWRTTIHRLTAGLAGSRPVRIMLQPIGDRRNDWSRVFDSAFLDRV